MPDIFIPIDTTRYTDYHRKIVAQGIVNKVVVQFNDKNRDKLKKKYKDFEKYYRDFTVDSDILTQIKEMAEKEGVVYDEEQFKKSENLIRLQLKAIIARDMWSVNEYYRIMDEENESLQRAVRILNTEGEYERILQ